MPMITLSVSHYGLGEITSSLLLKEANIVSCGLKIGLNISVRRAHEDDSKRSA